MRSVYFTKKSLQKFKALYFKHFQETLTDEEALRRATYLLELYRVVYSTPSVDKLSDNSIGDESEIKKLNHYKHE